MTASSPVRPVLVASYLLLLPILVAAQVPERASAGFGERPALELSTPGFTDKEIGQFLSTLDALLASAKVNGPARTDATLAHWNFARRLQVGTLNRAQEERVLNHLSEIAKSDPTQASLVAKTKGMVSQLTIGKTAPEIIGTDLDGAPLRLSEFRGKVVALVFGSEWCAICRTQYPYERLLMDLYKGWPFAIVGVDTGSSRDALKRRKTLDQLTYRSWWDPASIPGGAGPIATTWNAIGFPTVYLIDGDGVIRFVDIKNEDLLKGVRQLLEEQIEKQARR